MKNLDFFKACFQSELQATFDTIKAIPENKLDNQARSGKLAAFPFSSPSDLADKLKTLWSEATDILESYDDQKWEEETVSLLVGGKPFAVMPRFQMMWFFLNDIIHHRGQLSSYIRPMGGKNPAVYGWSADTVSA